jgi:hypothetical protein
MGLQDVHSGRVTGPTAERATGLLFALRVVLPDVDACLLAKVAERIDTVAAGHEPSPGWERTVFVGWQQTTDGVRLVQRGIRVALHTHGLSPTGDPFDAAYAYVREHY